MSGLYDFKLDQRVQSHPGTMYWARGLRYGNVVKIGRKLIHVQFDNWHGRPKTVSPGNLIIVEDLLDILLPLPKEGT